MCGAAADRLVDLAGIRRAGRCGARRGPGMPDADAVHQGGHRRPDRGPVRGLLGAGAQDCRAQFGEPFLVLQRRQAGPPQQRPQRRVAERGPVELAEMGVAAGVFQAPTPSRIPPTTAICRRSRRATG